MFFTLFISAHSANSETEELVVFRESGRPPSRKRNSKGEVAKPKKPRRTYKTMSNDISDSHSYNTRDKQILQAERVHQDVHYEEKEFERETTMSKKQHTEIKTRNNRPSPLQDANSTKNFPSENVTVVTSSNSLSRWSKYLELETEVELN